MYYTHKIPVPNGPKISRHPRKGIIYIEYIYARVYDPVRKFNTPKSTTIGKVCKDDEKMMFPNENYYRYFPDEVKPEERDCVRSGVLHIGAFSVIRSIIKKYEIDKLLEGIVGKDASLFLDFATYMIITENNAGMYYPDYAEEHPLFTEGMKIYSDTKISSMFKETDEYAPVAFLNEWNEKKDKRKRIYISYDSTNKNCQAGDIDIVEFGHAKDDKGLPIFNYSLAYDQTNKEPLFYEEYQGSVTDVSQLKQMVDKAKEYGYKNLGFILDRGYFSKSNLSYMDKNGYNFIIMCKGFKKLVREIIKENRNTFETDRNSFSHLYRIYCKRVKRKMYSDDEKERYFHLCFDSERMSKERSELENLISALGRDLDKRKGKYKVEDLSPSSYKYFILHSDNKGYLSFFEENKEVIEEEISLAGYFVIITSEKMEAVEALELYKNRDETEKLFRSDKTFLGNSALRIQSSEAARTKIFIAFIALIIRSEMYIQLRDERLSLPTRPNYFIVPAAVKELEKIKIIRGSRGKYVLDHAITKTQKAILKAFYLDAAFMQREAVAIAREIEEINKRG